MLLCLLTVLLPLVPLPWLPSVLLVAPTVAISGAAPTALQGGGCWFEPCLFCNAFCCFQPSGVGFHLLQQQLQQLQQQLLLLLFPLPQLQQLRNGSRNLSGGDSRRGAIAVARIEGFGSMPSILYCLFPGAAVKQLSLCRRCWWRQWRLLRWQRLRWRQRSATAVVFCHCHWPRSFPKKALLPLQPASAVLEGCLYPNIYVTESKVTSLKKCPGCLFCFCCGYHCQH